MSRHPNTFDEGDDINPFANASGQSSKSQLPTTRSDPNRHDATDDVPLGHEKDPKKKEKDIAAWEADLARREQEIKKREDALANAGFIIEEKNWPPFFPIIHHDIVKEIPVNAQRIQYLAFASWLGIMLCLVWNFVAVVACCIKGGGVKILFLSIIYALTGCPGSYLLWYKPLYNAMRTDSMLHFGWFFLVYLIHIGFCIVATIAPPILFEGISLTGFLAAFDTFSGSGLVGIFYLIGSCLFCLETLLSALVLQRIYAYFRGEK